MGRGAPARGLESGSASGEIRPARPSRSEGRVARVYVRLPNWVGDVVLATPFLRALRRSFPGSHLALHGRERHFDFLSGGGLFDEALPLRREGILWPISEGLRLRRGDPFDLAIVLPNSFSAALVPWVAGIPRRIGYRLDGRDLLLTTGPRVRMRGGLRREPMVDYYLRLAEIAGASTAGIPRCPSLPITAAARARARARHERWGAVPGPPLWALKLGAAGATKRWLPEYFAVVGDGARARGAQVIVLGGPGEEHLVAAAAAHMRERPLNGERGEDVVPLPDLAALLERCAVLVTTDSGTRHFGVSAGIPVVAVIGPTHPIYTRVEAPALRVLLEGVDCWPCHLEHCPRDFRCMRWLLPERVLAACDALLGERAVAGQLVAGKREGSP